MPLRRAARLPSLLCPALLLPTTHAAAPPAPLEVAVAGGRLRGVRSYRSRSFLGIPYAEPPIGPLRFRLPRPARNWSGTLAATEFPNGCIGGGEGNWTVAEDCLYLNVFTPPTVSAAPRPVLVWIHGGCYIVGNTYVYPLWNMSADLDAVVVSMEYRLNNLAYLAIPELVAKMDKTLNLGLMDQQLALLWVKENIHAFGGDPGHVLIFGQSAGGGSVASQLLLRDSWPAFNAAVMESPDSLDANGVCTFRTLEKALEQGQSLAASVGCNATKGQLECMRAVPAARLSGQFTPVVDGGPLFPDYPLHMIQRGTFRPATPIIVGSTERETNYGFAMRHGMPPPVGPEFTDAEYEERMGQFGVPAATAMGWYRAYRAEAGNWRAAARADSDWSYACPQRREAAALAAAGADVRFYWFQHHTRDWRYPFLNATHDSELPYVLRWPALRTDYAPAHVYDFTPAEWGLSTRLSSMWRAMAVAGDPNAAGVLSFGWPRYRPGGQVLIADLQPRTAPYPDAEYCAHWDAV